MKIFRDYSTPRFTAADLRRGIRLILAPLLLLFLFAVVPQSPAMAQQQAGQTVTQDSTGNNQPPTELLRLDKRQVAGGAELITISAQINRPSPVQPDPQTPANRDGRQTAGTWLPLVTVLRDTLGDADPDNDRLRYVWTLDYTRPSKRQRLASAIPFFYTRLGNKENTGKEPPPLIDLAAPDHDVWQRILWQALQSALLDPYGTPVRAATRSYQRNITDYRKSHVIRGLSVLSLYQTLKEEHVFSDKELLEIQARLWLTDKTFGGIVDEHKLRSFYQKQSAGIQDARGHNWELLRQQAENGGLYFQPLAMPDGSTTHALVWIARGDLETRGNDRFDGRFLSIANPWTDKRVLQWQGYQETRYLDAENRLVDSAAPGARAVEMIPLALYGLDSPKIPLLLVDFRDTLNPKRREMSRRALQDVTKNVLGLSQFGDLPYFLGHRVFDFVTGRRGVDINQPSRLRSYAQLKVLLTLNSSLAPELNQEVTRRLEKVSLNPAENDLETELQLAQAQYGALLAYAARPDGLPARIERDRRTELSQTEHNRKSRFVFKLANVLSFGRYDHREEATPDLLARLDLARSLAYHTRRLQEISRSSPRIEVSWDLQEIRRSLQFIAEHGSRADSKAAAAVAEIFSHTQDRQTRLICLEGLSRIDNQRARTVLTRISQDQQIDETWRKLSAQYLEGPASVRAQGDLTGTKSSATQGQQ